MSKRQKTWSIITAVVTGGVTIGLYTLAGPLAEAGAVN